MLKGLRNFLNMDRLEHHSTDHLKERGVEKGSGRHSPLRGRVPSVLNQTNIGTVSKATLGRLLRDGAERVWAFRTLRCHLELNPNLKLEVAVSVDGRSPLMTAHPSAGFLVFTL